MLIIADRFWHLFWPEHVELISDNINQPDLLIALSRDKVSMHFVSSKGTWKATYPIEGAFSNDQIAACLDHALSVHPEMIDQLGCVEVILLDQPSLFLANYYHNRHHLTSISRRYFRLRAGESIATDITDPIFFCYTLPLETLSTIKEYYANASCTHFASVLWNALSTGIAVSEDVSVYHIPFDNIYIVMGVRHGKLIFAKNFTIHHQDDQSYYALAVSRMLKPKSHFLMQIMDRPATFTWPYDSLVTVDQTIYLPSLTGLMALYKPCGS